MLSNKLHAVFLYALIMSASGTCAAQIFSCPEKIESPATSAGNYPGWKAFSSARPQYFDRISLTSGSPDQEASLVPDVDNKKLVGWNLSAGEEYWMVCHYLSSNVSLAQRLPANVKQCSVKLKSVGTKAMQDENALNCK
jgi:hypothetical protein